MPTIWKASRPRSGIFMLSSGSWRARTQTRYSPGLAGDGGISVEVKIMPYFRFAKTHCCNYSQTGPNGKIYFCWLEPKKTGSVCLIKSGQYCNWFDVAVLPLDRGLWAQWRADQIRPVKPKPGAPVDASGKFPEPENLTCECGSRFKPTGRRQRVCPACAKVKAKERIVRYRAKKA